MTLSANFFTKTAAVCLWLLFWCGSWSGKAPAETGSHRVDSPLIAVMPIENLSGLPAPLDIVRNEIIFRLTRSNLKILAEDQLQDFIVRHRIRYTGGINRRDALLLDKETGAGAVLLTSLDNYNDRFPPKIALSARLVTTGRQMKILWMDGVGLAGDEAPGFLELGMIEDPDRLFEMALDRLTASLVDFLSGQTGTARQGGKRFGPQAVYSGSLLRSDISYSIAVLPFLNLSQRRHADQIMAHHFVRTLLSHANFHPVEPGAVRQALLNSRIVMGDGISLADAAALFSRLDVDLILSGRVFDYQDVQGEAGQTQVCFSTLLMEHQTRGLAWSARSCRNGDKGVFFFDLGRIRTAHNLAEAMVRGAVETLE